MEVKRSLPIDRTVLKVKEGLWAKSQFAFHFCKKDMGEAGLKSLIKLDRGPYQVKSYLDGHATNSAWFFKDENSRELKTGFYEFVQKVTISVSNSFHPNRFKVKKSF